MSHAYKRTHRYIHINTCARFLHADLKLFGFCFFSMFTRTVAASKEARGKNTYTYFPLYIPIFTFIHTVTRILISTRNIFNCLYMQSIKQVTRAMT